VEDDGGLAMRIATGLPVHKVPVTDFEHAVIVWLNLWIERCHMVPMHVRGVATHGVV
jgi:hypothetical protein